MYVGDTSELDIMTLEKGNIMSKGKTNQLAKNQDVILPKPDTGEGQEMDVTVQLKKYIEQLEFQGAPQGSSSQASRLTYSRRKW